MSKFTLTFIYRILPTEWGSVKALAYLAGADTVAFFAYEENKFCDNDTCTGNVGIGRGVGGEGVGGLQLSVF